ncbi:hypothetical protein AMTR_s00006p00265150 [Amborella trichopoda]|uniref:Uncharacterized protein n=1 Tax=Amborella trichopoda TaxID=13333 RepID=W1PFN4_AMBTC|nr:hypothetical protein AMTR_s00006p00265150 [Amborella trichopoda]
MTNLNLIPIRNDNTIRSGGRITQRVFQQALQGALETPNSYLNTAPMVRVQSKEFWRLGQSYPFEHYTEEEMGMNFGKEMSTGNGENQVFRSTARTSRKEDASMDEI